MTLRKVCCGYYDNLKNQAVPCPKPEEIEKNSHRTENDTHGPCDECHKKELEVFAEWNRKRNEK